MPVQLTTAESLDLQRMFREMVDAGDQACALEVSSHALAQDRAAGIDFDAVVFTNLTRDHLDFHKDLDDYFLAKRRLFLPDEGAQRRTPRRSSTSATSSAPARRGVPAAVRRRPLDVRRRRRAPSPARSAGRRSRRDLDLRADGSAFTLVGPAPRPRASA